MSSKHEPPATAGSKTSPAKPLSNEIIKADDAVMEMQHHLTAMTKELGSFSRKKGGKIDKKRGGAYDSPLAATFSSLGGKTSPPNRGAIQGGWMTGQAQPAGTGQAQKQWMYHGPTQSIVHEGSYTEPPPAAPMSIPSLAPRTALPAESRIERRKRILRNVLMHRLKREKYACAQRGLSSWRVETKQNVDRSKMESRMKQAHEDSEREMAFMRRLESAMRDLYSGMVEEMDGEIEGSEQRTETSQEAIALTDEVPTTTRHHPISSLVMTP